MYRVEQVGVTVEFYGGKLKGDTQHCTLLPIEQLKPNLQHDFFLNQESLYDSSLLIPCNDGLHEGSYSAELGKTEGSQILGCVSVIASSSCADHAFKVI